MEDKPILTVGFSGDKVVAFESRMAAVVEGAILKHSGIPILAPTVQEIPLENNPEAYSFGDMLLAGKIQMAIFMTGVGTRLLFDILSKRYDMNDIFSALRKLTVVARGPKPIQVLREFKIPATIIVPEPNTWRDIIEVLDMNQKSIQLSGACIAIQEYGAPSSDLVEALKKRNANVMQIPVYRWALPNDKKPVLKAIDEINSGRVSLVFFTSAVQIRHLFRIASEFGQEADLKRNLKRCVIASVGPTTSEEIKNFGLSVDFEPSHPKLGHLISECASAYPELIVQKKDSQNSPSIRLIYAEEKSDAKKLRYESVFLKACRLEKTERTPVWLMRQAGRYMKEYRRIRDRVPFIELCKNPELAAEVTITAVEKIKADAAIIFSDLLVIVEPLGLNLEYSSGDGPVISGELSTPEDIEKLLEVEPAETLSYVFDAIRLTRANLNPQTPLIGFAGAPFTLAAYILEGGGSKAFIKTKRWMYTNPQSWDLLMMKISRALVKYIDGQINAGADAIQIFDSWVGCLGPSDYRKYVLPYSKYVMQHIKKTVPVIHFGTGTSAFLKEMKEAGGQVIGVDFRVDLDKAWNEIGYDRGIQGNLDPIVLLSTPDEIRQQAKRILDAAGGRPGHIFNLGHGILPPTPVDHVLRLIDDIRELSSK